MSRGDRSRQERTTEERERDREERERRRAERNPGAQPPPAPPSVEPEPAPFEEEPVEPEPAPFAPESEPLEAEPEPPAPEPEPPAPEPEPPAPEPEPPAPEPEPFAAPPTEAVPLEPPTEPLEVLPPEPEPLPPEPEPLPPEPEFFPELPAAGVREIHEQQPEAPELAREDHPGETAPVVETPMARERAPEPPASPPSRLGTPPPPVSERKRRAWASSGLPAAGSRWRHTRSRVAALIALGAVLVAVVIAIVSLSSGSHSKASALPAVVNILIPEGKTRVQIGEIAKAKGLTGSYRRAAQHSALLNPVHYGAPKSTPDLEGFLFPATYELDKGAPAARLVEAQLTAFTEHFGPKETAAAKALHVTPYGLLTVASMVEREAQVPSDRAKIAAVIYNRLAQGVPLGIDASIYYAVELEKGIATYTKELTESQLHINSPYNTRTHTGLPPTPISNPGDASIHAAAHPAKVSYLYYVAGADGCGEQVFSETQAQFETDVAAYKAAVAKNGGHPPSCKKK